jgi:hypothetical protein
MSTFTGSPAVSGDDWTITPSTTSIDTAGLLLCGRDLGTIHEFGVRIPSLPVMPAGESTVQSGCKLTLTANATGSNTTTRVRIYGVLATAPVAPTTYAQVVALARTVAFVDWEVPAVTANQTYDTPELSTIFQELIDDGCFSASASCILLFTNNGSDLFSDRAFKSKDSASGAPVLTLVFGPDGKLCIGQVTVKPALCSEIATVSPALCTESVAVSPALTANVKVNQCR